MNLSSANKHFIKKTLIIGIFFSLLMTALMYYYTQEILWYKSLYYIILFGLPVSWIERKRYLRKQEAQVANASLD